MDRRNALVRLGLGAASCIVAPRLWAAPPSYGPGGPDGVDELARKLAGDSHADALARVARARYRGVPYSGEHPFAEPNSMYTEWYEYAQAYKRLETVFQALFRSGAFEVRPGPLDGRVQAVLTVPTVRLSRPTSMREAWVAAVWCVGLVKRAQAIDRREGDWKLRGIRSSPSSLHQAATAFDDAMTRWDVEAADDALTGVLRFAEADALFHLVWPYAARCFVGHGQKIVLAAQVHRHVSTSRAGQEAVLRWMVRGLLYAPDATGPQMDVYARSRARLRELPLDWQKNKEKPARSVNVLRELRGGSSEDAQGVVVAALRKGLGADTIWDGLSLYASEIALQRPDGAENRRDFMLPLLEIDAFRHAYGHAWHPATRKLLLLQAAGWLPLLRDRAVAGSSPLAGVGIDQLGDGIAANRVNPRRALEKRSAAEMRVSLDESRKLRPRDAFDRHLTDYFISRCDDPLQYQYAFAAFRQVELAARRWRSRILAPIVRSIPVPQDPETDAFLEAQRVVRATTP